MITDLLERIFPKSGNNSREQAKQRLKLVLAHDRADLNPQVLDNLRRDILEVVARYVELDTDSLVFSLESDQRTTALIANLPIRRIKAQPIEAATPGEVQPAVEISLGEINLAEVTLSEETG